MALYFHTIKFGRKKFYEAALKNNFVIAVHSNATFVSLPLTRDMSCLFMRGLMQKAILVDASSVLKHSGQKF